MKNQNIEELKKYGRILNEEVESDKIDPVIGRDQEIRRIIEILSRKKKNNPLLIGDAGVGKTAIVEGLAQRIVSQDVPGNLKQKKIFELNFTSLISGTRMHGDFEQRLKTITDIIKKDNEYLLFIDELHLIVGAGRTQGAIDASNILKPMLARGELRCIGATTNNEYRQFIEKDAALERRFQKINVFEPDVEETITILRGLKNSFEAFHEVSIKDKALIAATKLSNQYINLRYLPDKAIDLVDEACAKLKTEIWSVPTPLDEVNRKIIQLEIENKTLKKEEEKDSETLERLKVIKDKIEEFKKIQNKLNKQWKEEKAILKDIINCKKKLLDKQKELKNAMQQGIYDNAAELKYQIIPKLQKKLEDIKKNSNNFENKNRLLKNSVDEDDIATVVSNWTHIPVTKLLKDEKKRYLNLFKELQNYVKGQDHALKSVSNAIIRSRAGLNDDSQPIASFLFVGSTGVGKTLVAKALAEVLFSSHKNIFQFDMSEYNTKHSVSRLIGSPPGYIGYEQGGQLTEKVKNNPYCVILFDELEKSSAEVQNLLLQILEEGRLTDGLGKTISFTNTVIIMTSNLGGELINENNYNEKNVLEEVRKNLKSELYNRIDEVVVFNQLNRLLINEIINLELMKLIKKIKNNKNIILQFDNKVISQISKDNYLLNYGARPIKHYINKNILPIIAKKIIEDKIVENQLYNLTFINNKFKIIDAIIN